MNLTETKNVISSFLKRDELMFNLEQKQNISRAFAITITDIDALVDENKQLEMSRKWRKLSYWEHCQKHITCHHWYMTMWWICQRQGEDLRQCGVNMVRVRRLL